MITNGYEDAVNLRGSSIAVSASAGCGKTTSMIRRIAKIILDEKINVSNLLIVTFTRAAAAEMKQRLKEELLRHEGDVFALKQAKETDIADISTIHSFCSKVCSEFFNAAEISPDFSIAEENEMRIYRKKILGDIIEEYYSACDPKFFELSQILSDDRSDGGLMNAVNDLYELTLTIPDFENYLKDDALKLYKTDGEKNAAVQFLNREIFDAASDAIQKISFCLERCKKTGLCKNTGKFEAVLQAAFSVDKNNALSENAKAVEQIVELLDFRIVSEKPQAGTYEYYLYDFMKNLKTSLSKRFVELASLCGRVLSQNGDQLEKTGGYLEKLTEVTLAFRKRFMRFKLDNSLLDFGDLEYYTLKILKDNACRETLSKRYIAVFVDEFQDTNRVQDEIISLLAKEDNLFIVGDMKQSIYRFRGAESLIFKEKTMQPSFACLNLGTNFRSDINILNFVNEIFSLVMKESFSHVNYISEGMLSGLKTYPLSDGRPSVIIDVLSAKKDEECETEENGETALHKVYSVKENSKETTNEEENAAACEGKHIAARIQELIGGRVKVQCSQEELYKRALLGKTEYLCYDDITVLVRAAKVEYTSRLTLELEKAGIPVSAEFSNSINDYFEITDLIEYLKIIDNFRQDIPLLTALKSGLFNFTDDELSEIRIFSREGFFHEAMIKFKEAGSGTLHEKTVQFFSDTAKYTELSKTLSAPRLLMKIIADTNYQGFLLSQGGGRENIFRVNNFLKLIYQKAYSYNLTEFLYYMETASDQIKLSLGVFENSKVHICTIHASKGLEYPVVFIAGCGRKYGYRNNRKLYMHRSYGLAMDYYDTENKVKKPSYIKDILYRIRCQEDTCDSINVLYVAMTRAKYRLYMTGMGNADIPPLMSVYDIKNSSSFFDYILSAVQYDANNSDKRENFLFADKNSDCVYEFNSFNGLTPEQVAEKQAADLPYITPLCEYPYRQSTFTPLKNSVTSVISHFEEDSPPANFLFSNAGGSIEEGNEYHKALELIDFKIFDSDIGSFIEKLKGSGQLPQNSKVNPFAIARLLKCKIFDIARQGECFREKAFMMNISGTAAGYASDEEILIQGKLDLLMIDGKKAYIADYKYSAGDRDYLLSRYSGQLRLYRAAVEKILGIPVEKCVIINIKTCEEIEI